MVLGAFAVAQGHSFVRGLGTDGASGKTRMDRQRASGCNQRMSQATKAAAAAQSVSEMIWLEGGLFQMGSDRHYPEEAPRHPVKVDGFWIDRTPVTNRQFAEFVEATGHVTTAEIAPDAKDYPGALPEMLKPGSLLFVPTEFPVDTSDWSRWWTFCFGADWRHPLGPGSSNADLMDHPVIHVTHGDAAAYAEGRGYRRCEKARDEQKRGDPRLDA